ncbi:hypothetical protein NDU88_002706 [Pleurodeles waltl]|uniref:Uncharacterized protein n=1 Tax=Pleurodeles waltl TaxID=8319 RepID=A0AAV7UWY3_PLEWA|nr:hypothetical protein NDU88_002706 [Pleurodeles waltl]
MAGAARAPLRSGRRCRSAGSPAGGGALPAPGLGRRASRKEITRKRKRPTATSPAASGLSDACTGQLGSPLRSRPADSGGSVVELTEDPPRSHPGLHSAHGRPAQQGPGRAPPPPTSAATPATSEPR